MHNLTLAALTLLILTAPAVSQTSLLNVTANMPALAPARVTPGAQASTSAAYPDAFSVTMLARVIAAEAGGNWFSSLAAKKAVGGAMVNQVKRRFGVPALHAEHIQRIFLTQPGFLSSWRDRSLHHFYRRDAKWLAANGYSQCLAAARAALAGEDPSRGATNWYDRRIAQPFRAGEGVVTATARTVGPTIVFYYRTRR